MSTKRILIIGAGVVGHATGTGFERKGYHVSYVDIMPAVIAKLRGDGHNAMTMAEVNWSEVDIIMVTVSTPTRNNKIVLSHVMSAMRDIAAGLKTVDHFVTLVVRSTVPPTTTEQILLPLLEEGSGKMVGKDFGVAVNPEFLRQAQAVQDFERPWITVLGCADMRSVTVLREIYSAFGAMIVFCSPTEAEMIKYINNVYNAVKISYFNEVHAICKHLGINGDTVASVVSRSAESMWNPLYGTRGGVPYGGACLPKDTLAFLEFARDHGLEHLMLEATIEVNRRLEATVKPATSPDQIDMIRNSKPIHVEIPGMPQPHDANVVPYMPHSNGNGNGNGHLSQSANL